MEFTKENTAGVGKILSGLYIVAATDGKECDGFLASWVQQISFDPLLLTVAIKPGRPCYDLINSGGLFTINVVGEDNTSVMKPFWSGHQPGVNPFADLETSTTENGSIVLDQAVSVIECRMVSSSKPGDHELVIAEVVSSKVVNGNDKPKGHLRKSGLDY